MKRLAAAIAMALMVTSAWALDFSVDASALVSHAFPLNGVNDGPGHVRGGISDVSDQYREMGITMVRTHDYYGPCDYSTIFPSSYDANDPWGADAYSNSSYDFSDSDATVAEIEALGADVFFRLGESWNNADPHNRRPPQDKYGTVAHVSRHIAKHYGADTGRVTMWEFWNEPNHDMFWDKSGYPNENAALEPFFGLYVWVAQGLKDKFPEIMVGGPGAAGGSSQDIQDFCRKFCHSIKKKHAPLDFYSWHSYNREGDGPYIFVTQANMVRHALNTRGYPNTLSILGEWNASSARAGGPDPSQEALDQRNMLWNMDGAAFTASALIYLNVYSDVRYAFRYRGDIHSGDHGYGLVDTHGDIKKPGYAFKAYSYLFPQHNTIARPEMYMLTCGGDNQSGRAIMATMDGNRRVINILVSLWKGHGPTISVDVTGVPKGWTSPRVEHYLLDKTHDFELMDEGTFDNSDGAYTFSRQGDGQDQSEVHLIRLYDTTQFPLTVQAAPMP
jgi:hypothetical protein